MIESLIKKYQKEIEYWKNQECNLTNEQHAIYMTELDVLQDLKELKEKMKTMSLSEIWNLIGKDR